MAEGGVGGVPTYGLKFQARSLAAHTADKQRSRWLVGTNSLREENEVHLIEFDPEQDVVKCVAVFAHESEVWDIGPCPLDKSLVSTVCNQGGVYRAAIWSMSVEQSKLAEVCELKCQQGLIRRVLWSPEKSDRLVSIEESRLRIWCVRDGTAECLSEASPGELQQLWTGCWDPHNANRLCAAAGNSLQVWDLRSTTKKSAVEAAHQMPIRDVDFSCQREHYVVTAGDDCKLHFWDLRGTGGSNSQPLLELAGHTHWVWQAKFNPAHDQLVVSGSSDSTVGLWYVPSAMPDGSSRAGSPGRNGLGFGKAAQPSERAHTCDDHEDSVYGLAWSVVDPWIFASLSYDGRIVVNSVPSQTKYKIII